MEASQSRFSYQLVTIKLGVPTMIQQALVSLGMLIIWD
jgi:hypothetical protein